MDYCIHDCRRWRGWWWRCRVNNGFMYYIPPCRDLLERLLLRRMRWLSCRSPTLHVCIIIILSNFLTQWPIYSRVWIFYITWYQVRRAKYTYYLCLWEHTMWEFAFLKRGDEILSRSPRCRLLLVPRRTWAYLSCADVLQDDAVVWVGILIIMWQSNRVIVCIWAGWEEEVPRKWQTTIVLTDDWWNGFFCHWKYLFTCS